MTGGNTNHYTTADVDVHLIMLSSHSKPIIVLFEMFKEDIVERGSGLPGAVKGLQGGREGHGGSEASPECMPLMHPGDMFDVF